MKKSLKVVSLYVICAILFTLLSGCGSKTTNSGSVATLTWYMQKPVADMSRKAMVEEEANKIIEKEVGARIKFEFIDSGARDSRINAMIAAGEEFDLLLDMGSSFANNLRKNAFVDVTEYIDKYGADIKAKLDDFAWKAVEYEGGLYGVPGQTFYTPYSSFAFKKDLIDKYNFDYKTVKSYAELEPFLKKIKDNEPEVYPIIATSRAPIPQSQTTQYLPTGIKFVVYDKTDDKFISDIDSPYSLERYKTTYDYFQKGYIAKDAASKTDLTSEIKSGKYAVFAGRRSASKSTNLYGFDCVESDPTYGTISTDNIANSITAISRTSKNPQKAIQALNLIWKKPELSNLLAYGIEDLDYTVVSGKGTQDMSIDTKSGNNVKWSIWHNWIGPLWDQWDSPWNSKESLIEMQEINRTAEISPILGFRPDLSEFKTEVAMLDSIFTETTSALNTGSMPNFDEYVTTVEKRYSEAGIDKVINEIERQYIEWQKTQ